MPEVALIIGAGGGLGRAFCEALRRQNFTVVVAGRNSIELDDLVTSGLASRRLICDLAEFDAAETLAEQLGDVSLLVVAAGGASAGLYADRDWASLRDEIAVNALAMAHVVHVFGRRMLATGGGRIVLIGSTAASRPAAGLAAYAASKAFLRALTESLAVEWRPKGVRITCCVTGPMATGFALRAGLRTKRFARDPARVAAAALAVRSLSANAVVYTDWGAWLRARLFSLAPRALWSWLEANASVRRR